ncbi:hypothetical protein SAMN04487820_107136 [Actinopolyspora mzabensis]|uniref:J domain-containing protein n=1 Tax=Actinopolyspora mzabensis TaxID=995066 RepID=A0A1G9BG79_ACTMZ|nr:hypothetical protein [Actinopolyspora mzabensis]SDK38473.1 hypothetical protein SAMN04487820_107136 [Actinopolyspora mzabensis]
MTGSCRGTDSRRDSDDAREARVRLREFVRANHPDVGGDPEVFAAGVAELQSVRDGVRSPHETPTHLPGETMPGERGDGPVVLVRRHGLRGLLARLREWRARRGRGPRVV